MNSLVVYDSKFGNTRKVAQIIADGLAFQGGARASDVEHAVTESLETIDLLVLGGPTQAHGVSPRMRGYLEVLVKTAPSRLLIGAFDTRLKGPGFLWGSAAKAVAAHISQAGLELIAQPMSFLVEGMSEPRLVNGEADRAKTWALDIGARAAARHPAAV